MSFSSFTVSRKGKVVQVIVIHDETMEGLRGADPAVLEGHLIAEGLSKMSNGTPPEVAAQVPIGLLDIFIAYEPSQEAFLEKVKELGAANDVLNWLARGWTNTAADAAGERWVTPAAEGTMYSKPTKDSGDEA